MLNDETERWVGGRIEGPLPILLSGGCAFRYPATLRANECLWDRDFRCIRGDHQHDNQLPES